MGDDIFRNRGMVKNVDIQFSDVNSVCVNKQKKILLMFLKIIF
jgi:hypothetical protein